jgi:hypothetical protein
VVIALKVAVPLDVVVALKIGGRAEATELESKVDVVLSPGMRELLELRRAIELSVVAVLNADVKVPDERRVVVVDTSEVITEVAMMCYVLAAASSSPVSKIPYRAETGNRIKCKMQNRQ